MMECVRCNRASTIGWGGVLTQEGGHHPIRILDGLGGPNPRVGEGASSHVDFRMVEASPWAND